MSVVTKIYAATYKFFKDHPGLFLPFLLLFLVQIFALIVLYFAPRLPLRTVFEPIIRTFWGLRFRNIFLHYPSSFILLPKLFQISSLALSVFVGALTSGIAIAIISGIYNKKKADFLSATRLAISKYMYLFIIVVLWVVALHYSTKLFDKGTVYLTGFLLRFTSLKVKYTIVLSAIT